MEGSTGVQQILGVSLGLLGACGNSWSLMGTLRISQGLYRTLGDSWGAPRDCMVHLRDPKVSWEILETLDDFWRLLGSPWDS